MIFFSTMFVNDILYFFFSSQKHLLKKTKTKLLRYENLTKIKMKNVRDKVVSEIFLSLVY
jgi:hypothetical protein